MNRIMIATGNENKVREYREMLEPLGYEIHSLSEIGSVEIVENGATFEENALIKVKAVHDRCGYMTIADDSGLSIKALNGAPGIYSARFMPGASYPEKNKAIIAMLQGSPDRSAWFTCAIALIDRLGQPHVFTGRFDGQIAQQPAGRNGFGYDPIFYLPAYGMTSAELAPEKKNAISHRGQATRQLLAWLRDHQALVGSGE